MIALVFSKEDLEASDIALKTGLDSGKGIYVVPKYSFREEEVVFARLSKSKAAILIITDPFISPDRDTIGEIRFLLENRKPVHAIFLSNSRAEEEIVELTEEFGDLLNPIVYDAENPESILEMLKKEIDRGRISKEPILVSLLLIISGFMLHHLLSDGNR